MKFTKTESQRLKEPKLRPGCKYREGAYLAYIRLSDGSYKYFGSYTTAQACNEAHDKNSFRKGPKKRKYADKGFVVRHSSVRKRYCGQVSFNGNKYLGSFSTEDGARAAHRQAIDRINEGTFEDWYNSGRRDPEETSSDS